jgi:hypothetical protein
MGKIKLQISNTRKKQLALSIVDYLTDWVDGENVTKEESICCIKNYYNNVSFENPDDLLVKAAIKHFIYNVNPFYSLIIPDYLVEYANFTELEANHYYTNLYI